MIAHIINLVLHVAYLPVICGLRVKTPCHRYDERDKEKPNGNFGGFWVIHNVRTTLVFQTTPRPPENQGNKPTVSLKLQKAGITPYYSFFMPQPVRHQPPRAARKGVALTVKKNRLRRRVGYSVPQSPSFSF
jgi:hypothetical protein